MRLMIELSSERENISLPIGYNHILQGFFYALFSKRTADFLHSRGFLYEKRGFKLFTFSKITGKKFEIKDKQINFYPPIKLYFASAVDKFAADIVESLIKKQDLQLGKNNVAINNLKVLTAPKFEESGIYKTLSPISVYSTTNQRSYFMPDDKEFQRLLKENIKKKYEILTDKKIEDFEFTIYPIGKYKHTFIRYKGGVKEGVEGKFFIRCDPSIMNKIYDAGIGSNTSSGFGMIEFL